MLAIIMAVEPKMFAVSLLYKRPMYVSLPPTTGPACALQHIGGLVALVLLIKAQLVALSESF